MVVYACNSCGYNAADLAGSRRLEVHAGSLPVWVPCTGRLSVDDMLHPFTRGAAGVLVAACLPDQCTFVDGNAAMAERLERARGLLVMMGIDPDRLPELHPTYRMLTLPAETLQARAESLAGRLRKALPAAQVETSAGVGYLGSGSLPMSECARPMQLGSKIC